jgi:hypothetical protein
VEPAMTKSAITNARVCNAIAFLDAMNAYPISPEQESQSLPTEKRHFEDDSGAATALGHVIGTRPIALSLSTSGS